MINFKILTLFPQLFPGPLDISITGEALRNKIWSLQTINIRDYAFDNRGSIDDTPYGGGAGMLMRADVVGNAIQKNISSQDKTKIIYLSPKGKLFKQETAQKLAKESEIVVLCGRYEGVDQRVIDEFAIEEISIGDYIISGGEIACYVFIDAIIRNIKGVLGAQQSLQEESFSFAEDCDYFNLLEYPHYTRPASWCNRDVPEVLLSGNHKNIANWRKEKAIEITKKNRPDLLKNKS